MLRVNDLKLWSMAKNGHQEVLHTMNPDKYYIVGSSSNEHCHVQINVMIPSSDEKQKEDKSKDGTAINQKGLDKEEMKNHLSPMLIRAMVTTCPGYESLVDDIVMLANITIRAGSPSGVAIVGCSGVGKTRLVSSIVLCVYIPNSKQGRENECLCPNLYELHGMMLSFLYSFTQSLNR
jgi:DNA replication protein DnaC